MKADFSSLGGGSFLGFFRLILGIFRHDQKDVWVWKSDPSRVLSVSSTYGILLDFSRVWEGRFEKVLWGIARIWMSRSPIQNGRLLLEVDLKHIVN